jgi:hypothetical protein
VSKTTGLRLCWASVSHSSALGPDPRPVRIVGWFGDALNQFDGSLIYAHVASADERFSGPTGFQRMSSGQTSSNGTSGLRRLVHIHQSDVSLGK